MSAAPQPAIPSDELLQRVLKALEPPKPKRGFELICAVILSLAATASAWCAYQSKLWGGEQMARSNVAAQASREQAVNGLASIQARTFDASMFISDMQAKLEHREAFESYLFQRFRPEMRQALDAWLKLDPMNNPSAPLSPFSMAEYAQKDAATIERLETTAAAAVKSAREARQASDNYVLLTVLYASVLFFGGIARAFDSRLVRTVLTGLAVILFMATFVGLISMPVHHV